LRLIATRSTGFDHIEIAYCEERGIKVCHVPRMVRDAVAHFGSLQTSSVRAA
jgi:D-lactate dehydrogenase